MRTYQLDPSGKKRVTLIAGDGIGSEVTAATRRVLEAAGAPIAWEVREAGAAVFKRGLMTGVPEETIASLRETRVALKGPLETPIGYGEKSANVTLRKLFETYGNLRPIRELPGVATPFSGRGIDLVVVRENVEDLYAGIEHQQTPGVAQCLKLMSRKGCEKIVRLAFEVAVAEGRRSVTCATKANIMKLTEGLLKRTFEEVAKEYPTIEARTILVDACAHQLVRTPEAFEVIVTSNMNGDILSDLTSGLVGGLGFAPGANVGADVAIFEAVHGSAPLIAGKDIANPSAVLLSAVMMLRHLDEPSLAMRVEDALLATLEQGVLTADVAAAGTAVGTQRFADEVIARLGQRPTRLGAREQRARPAPVPLRELPAPTSRVTVGADVFIEDTRSPAEIGPVLERLVEGSPLALKMISNRGTVVYPDNGAMTDCVDHHRCRFKLRDRGGDLTTPQLLDLLQRVGSAFRFMHVEALQELDGARAYTLAQGEDDARR
ncbi:MAG: NADP-dependent isocitrate dehydrogenase [Kofleriaceae bacterium]|nr:NADP-dependent isocitrate dehydrogenase [Kofleriaceae bacterium]